MTSAGADWGADFTSSVRPKGRFVRSPRATAAEGIGTGLRISQTVEFCVRAVLRHGGFLRAAVARLCQYLPRRASGCAVFRAAVAFGRAAGPASTTHFGHVSRPTADPNSLASKTRFFRRP